MNHRRVCQVDECSSYVKGHDYCSRHYDRWRATGNPTGTTRCPPGASLDEKLRWHGWSVTESGCWEWAGRHNRQGYGQLKHEARYEGAHRWAYRAWVGPIPEGLFVLHHCDNPPCINPEHLYAGTHAQNMQDALDRDRYAGRTGREGELNASSVLTDAQRRELVQVRLTEGLTYKELGRRFGVSKQTAHYTVTVWAK